MTAPHSPSNDTTRPMDDESGQVRTLFISDVYLGAPDCQAALLSKLLRRVRPQQLYLVGDIVDLLAMCKRAVLDRDQQALVARVLHLARSGYSSPEAMGAQPVAANVTPESELA